MTRKKFIVVAHANLGNSLSGGDRIFLNLIKFWQSRFDIQVLASHEAVDLISKFKLNQIKLILTSSRSPVKSLNTFSLFYHHLTRFFSGLFFCLQHSQSFKEADYIYTSSDFYADFVFGLFSKIFHPQIIWLCGFYLLAPNPFNSTSPYQTNHRFFRGLIYYLAQLPTIFLAKHLADFIFVTSVPDQKVFQPRPSIVVQGGVAIPSAKVLKSLKPAAKRPYEALFIGRLHTQKGVLELIDIWQKVVRQKPNAKLAIIGDGELHQELVSKISRLHLQSNIKLAGFQIGRQKFQLIKNSRLILHPATYDSGGMAAAEAMAYGLPGVSYDLPALKTYYPQGMVKVPCFDQDQFCQTIVNLLTDAKLYSQTSINARKLILSHWSWKKRFDQIYQTIKPDKTLK